jgi:hypothetical protein
MMAWPSVLLPSGGGFATFVRSLSGGQSLSGIEQVQPQRHDRWRAQFMFPIRREAEVLAFRALVTGMRGRAGTVLLPAFDKARAPWPVVFGVRQTPSVVRTRALDGTVYADSDAMVDALIAATVSKPAALNATRIRVTFTAGGEPLPGYRFSIASRMYEILSVSGLSLAGQTYQFDIWPWLRTDVSAGTAVNFTSPKCEMRFQTDGEGADALLALEGLRTADATLRFDEASAS